jgi:hypothetical protein
MNDIKQRAYALLDAMPDALETVCDHIANGGSLVELSALWKLRYSDMVSWLYESEHSERRTQYERSLKHRDEWGVERVLFELRSIAFVDLRQAFDELGRLKPLSELPQPVAAALAGMETYEVFEKDSDGAKVLAGQTRKVKFSDKLKAMELLGKQLKMFVDRHEVTQQLTLEQLVGGSWGEKGPPSVRSGEPNGAEPRPSVPSEAGDAGPVDA